MAARSRKRLSTGLALLVAALLSACTSSPSAPTAPPSPSPSTVAPAPTPTPFGSASLTPPRGHTYVIGVLGDYGVDAAPVRAVVREMQRFAPHLAAVVTTGDNAYCCGKPAQVAFAKSVLAPLHTTVYPAFGNHDEVTQGGQPLLAAFGLTQRWYDVTVGPVEFVFLDANQPGNRAQLVFLDQVLARRQTAAYRVVVFHQPGWSCSVHAPDPGVVRYFLPRLSPGKVDLVLAGHNHTYERFYANDGTPLVTTGGGGAPLYPSVRAACRGAGRVVHVKTVNHALRLTADDVFLKVEAIGTDGTVFDHFVIPRAAR